MKKIILLSFVWLSIPAAYSALQTSIDFNHSFDGTNLHIIWNAYPGKSYAIQSATNLSGNWSNSPALVATTNSIASSFPRTGQAQFFRVIKLDTEGPEISQSSPLDGGIAVSSRSAIQALLYDATGINSNSISLTIGTNAPISLTNPRLTFATNVLTYLPGTNEFLGTNGQIVTVALAVADTLGNQTTNAAWSFQLELSPVLNTNIFFIGAGSPGCSLALLSTNGDTFTFSYAGASSCLSTGMHLINTNLLTGYTRTVVGFTQYPASNTVVVLTRPTKLAELLEVGSANTGGFANLSPQARGKSLFGTGPADDLNAGIRLEYDVNLQKTLVNNGTLLIESRPGSYFKLSGELEATANFRWFRLREFQATIGGTADYRMDVRALVTGAADYSGTVPVITPIHKTHGQLIGLVPVWVELVFELEAGYDANFEASAEVTSGVQAVKEIQIGKRWDETNGWTVIRQNPPLGLTLLGPTWQIQGSANLRVFLRPKITLLAYSTAGVSGDLEPYFQADGHAQLNPPCLGLALSGGLDAHLGLDLRFWDDDWGDLPSKDFELIPQTTLWQTNTCPTNPVIVLHPVSQGVFLSEHVIFNVDAVGGELAYQWQRNGLNLTDDGRIVGARSSSLRISNVRAEDVSDYSVRVANLYGSTNSLAAHLSVLPRVPPGMVPVPAGVFTMGDALDADAEQPTHPVYVSPFFMDRFEITKAQWDDVRSWAVAHGYSFEFPQLGKSPSHPIWNMSWYEAAKWCNARSEKEGRQPAYYLNSAKTIVYRSGQVGLANSWVDWQNGYRLPTEAEWEKAARGGASGHRFPWNDTDFISHVRANYNALGGSYDLSAPQGYHPNFQSSGSPFAYTSPVGYFQPNGYGLYDMAGNVSEWCWDWYGTIPNSFQTDPHGVENEDSSRLCRGGDWFSDASVSRTTGRLPVPPSIRANFVGLRCVLPTPK